MHVYLLEQLLAHTKYSANDDELCYYNGSTGWVPGFQIPRVDMGETW